MATLQKFSSKLFIRATVERCLCKSKEMCRIAYASGQTKSTLFASILQNLENDLEKLFSMTVCFNNNRIEQDFISDLTNNL